MSALAAAEVTGRQAAVGADSVTGGRFKERLAVSSLRFAEFLAMRLPRPAGVLASETYFRALYRRGGGQRDTVADNLSRVLGHPPDSPLVQAATRECFELYGRYWYETFALRSMPVEEVKRRFILHGVEHLDRALDEGKGILVALPHMGNWDFAGHWLAVNGYRMTAVAEELQPRGAYELFFRHRRALGMNIVPLSTTGGGAGKAGQTLVRLLAENHIITLVADRDLTRRGVEVEMFGEKRRLPAGPAYLSLLTGAPLSVAAVFTTPDGHNCFINPWIEIERTGEMRRDVTAMTLQVAAQLERFIASAPTDWHMFQPAWD